MEKESNLQVTFSKRRSGLFKKASELSILCGVEIAIVVFSPAKKAFSFEKIFHQVQTPLLMEVHRNAQIHELNRQLTYVDSQLDIKKNKSDELSKIRKEGQDNHWWEAPTESLGLEELEQLKVQLGVLGSTIGEKKERSVAEAANAMAVVPISSSTGIDSGYGLSITPHGLVLGYGHFGN
ncbi:AGAMOUS-like 23 [Artemisia annua]|uniref:AGAMOUS-like 23 n=1 Tax=Artemisia annua TaxID=35608 RepID=A0A2U1P0C4_ARTAN|nr:AGAMOUS-like 23 [Artemisia annua]